MGWHRGSLGWAGRGTLKASPQSQPIVNSIHILFICNCSVPCPLPPAPCWETKNFGPEEGQPTHTRGPAPDLALEDGESLHGCRRPGKAFRAEETAYANTWREENRGCGLGRGAFCAPGPQEGAGQELVWEEKLRTCEDLACQAGGRGVGVGWAGSVSHSQPEPGQSAAPSGWEGSLLGRFILVPSPAYTGPLHFSQMTKSRGDSLDQRTLASL